jgi:hypothetical protein
MSALNAFIPLQKVDLARRQVWGTAAVEQPDRASPPEIMDYARSKPHFLAWSETVQKASQGKSLGNVRAMHGGQMLAVGKVIHLEPRDASRDIFVGVEVVDDAAWEKVQKGVYTGFSIGGKYGERWADELVKGATRYEAIPNELSLVDLPCIPDATFEVLKVDGASELRKFEVTDSETEKRMDEEKQTEGAQPPDESETPESKNNQPPAEETALIGEQFPAEAGDQEAETETESETPESAPSGVEGSAPTRAGLDEAGVKDILISLLMDLGLVQPTGAQPMSMAMRMDDLSKASQQLSVSSDQLQKAFASHRSQVEAQLAELRKSLGSDIAQIVAALQVLEKRGGQGPVIRDLGAISPQAVAEMQKASVLKDLLKDTADPLTRQKLQEEITRLEIKAVQTNK